MTVKPDHGDSSKPRSSGGSMSLWLVLKVLSGAVAIGNAWAAAKRSGGTLSQDIIALIIGLLAGTVCIWIIHRTGMTVRHHIHERYIWAIYFIAIVWILISGVIGFQLTLWCLSLLDH